jgi:hypothetical protein
LHETAPDSYIRQLLLAQDRIQAHFIAGRLQTITRGQELDDLENSAALKNCFDLINLQVADIDACNPQVPLIDLIRSLKLQNLHP